MTSILTAAAAAAVLAGCTATATPAPSPSMLSAASPSAPPSATPAVPSNEPSGATFPGVIEVLPCAAAPSPAPGTVCLGRGQGTVASTATAGSHLTVTMSVTNPGSDPSTPISLIFYELDAGPLPFGAPACAGCSSTATKPFPGLEWPALAAGETRQLTFDLPITAAPGGTIWFASLYGRALSFVEVSTATGPGLGPQEDWKVSTTVTP